MESKHRLREVALVFLKLGTIAFGGPAAHIAMMRSELVDKRRWVDEHEFLDLLGAANLIPGPNSTELAIHLGYKRAGWAGLVTAGACFIVPAMLIVWAFAAIYARYQSVPELGFVLYGVKPVILAIVLQALLGLGKSAVKGPATGTIAAATLVLAVLGVDELLLLALAGAAAWVLAQGGQRPGRSAAAYAPLLLLLAGGPVAAETGKGAISLAALFWSLLKTGSVLYGSGYVLLAFLQRDFVDKTHALTPQQLLDAVAVGQFTPGPVFTTATFVGYLLHGTPGALLATLAIFLPAFVFVALTNPIVRGLRRSKPLATVLDGVNAASLALMAAAGWQLGKAAVVDVWTVVLGAASLLLLLRYKKLNSVWLVLGGAAAGALLHLTGLIGGIPS